MFNNNRDTVESLRESLQSMENQLIAMYDEKQSVGNESEIHELREAVASFEEQLNSIYQEKNFPTASTGSSGSSEVTEMITSLEDQVKSLIDEKMDLEHKVAKSGEERIEMQKRARELGSALFEAAIVGRMPNVG